MERGEMVQIYDFTAYAQNNRDYGGNSGLKLGIDMEGDAWYYAEDGGGNEQ